MRIPGSAIFRVGKLLFGQDFFVYGAILLTAGSLLADPHRAG